MNQSAYPAVPLLAHPNRSLVYRIVLHRLINSGVTDSLPLDVASSVRALNVILLLLCNVCMLAVFGWLASAWYSHIPVNYLNFGTGLITLFSIYFITFFINGMGFHYFARFCTIGTAAVHFFAVNAFLPTNTDELFWAVVLLSAPLFVIYKGERGWFIGTYFLFFCSIFLSEIFSIYFPPKPLPYFFTEFDRYLNLALICITVTAFTRYYRNAAIAQQERLMGRLGKIAAPEVRSALLESRPHLTDRCVVTVFFSDIVGFSSIAEQWDSNMIVRILNLYFESMTKFIQDYDGIVDKYIGDGVMAFWSSKSLPNNASSKSLPNNDHAALACLAALAQQEALDALRKEMAHITGLRRKGPELLARMGAATGEATVGLIGSTVLQNYTVIGDTVNLASRLESVNKNYGTRIMISEDTFMMADEKVAAREIDLITVAGRETPVRIYELLAKKGELTSTALELHEHFAKGLTSYRQQEWELAERTFTQCLHLRSNDRPSQQFICRIGKLRQRNDLPRDWDGVWPFSKK
jgi:class 3 adenylate cyclase